MHPARPWRAAASLRAPSDSGARRERGTPRRSLDIQSGRRDSTPRPHLGKVAATGSLTYVVVPILLMAARFPSHAGGRFALLRGRSRGPAGTPVSVADVPRRSRTMHSVSTIAPRLQAFYGGRANY